MILELRKQRELKRQDHKESIWKFADEFQDRIIKVIEEEKLKYIHKLTDEIRYKNAHSIL